MCRGAELAAEEGRRSCAWRKWADRRRCWETRAQGRGASGRRLGRSVAYWTSDRRVNHSLVQGSSAMIRWHDPVPGDRDLGLWSVSMVWVYGVGLWSDSISWGRFASGTCRRSSASTRSSSRAAHTFARSWPWTRRCGAACGARRWCGGASRLAPTHEPPSDSPVRRGRKRPDRGAEAGQGREPELEGHVRSGYAKAASARWTWLRRSVANRPSPPSSRSGGCSPWSWDVPFPGRSQ